MSNCYSTKLGLDQFDDVQSYCQGITEILPLETYLQCDPTNGAFGKKFATDPSIGVSIKTIVAECQGSELQTVLNTYSEQIESGLQQHEQSLVSYEPDFSSVLQPVLRIEYKDGNVIGCAWLSNVYQQAEEPVDYYPR